MKAKSFFWIVAIALFLLALTYAQAELKIIKVPNEKDFTIRFLKERPAACACSTFIDEVVIENTGDWPAIFDIETSPALGISNNHFELWPNKSITILISSQDKECKARTFPYTLKIKNNLGFSKEYERKVEFVKCNNLEVSLIEGKSNLLPCEPVTFKLRVENPSNFKDMYEVKLKGDVAKYFNVSAKRFTLLPKQATTLTINGSLACELYGNYSLDVYIESLNNQYYLDLPILLNVSRAYEYELSREDSREKCNNKWQEVKLKLSNKGAIDNSYNIEVIGFIRTNNLTNASLEVYDLKSGFLQKFLESITSASIGDAGFIDVFRLSFNNQSFNVSKGKEKEIIASFFVDKSLVGKYYLAFKILPKYGDFNREVFVPIEVEKCYDYSLSIEDKPNVVDQNTYVAKVKVQNSGSKTDYLTLDYGNVSYLRLSENKFYIASNETKYIDLYIDGTKALQALNESVVKATLNASSPNHYIVKEASFNFVLVSNYTATKTSVDKTSLIFWEGKDREAIKVKNIGYFESEYVISLEPSNLVEIEGSRVIKLAPEESKKLSFIFNSTAHELGTYKVNLTLTSLRNGQSYKYEITIYNTSVPLIVAIELYFKERPCVALTILLLIALIVVLIFYFKGRKKARVWSKKELGKVYFITLIVYALLFIVMLNTLGWPQMYRPQYQEVTPLYFIVPADQNLSLNLSQYFYDPDGDTLRYEMQVVKENERINYSIENATLNVKPLENRDDWFEFKVIAFDPKGLNATSSKFSVRFLKVPEYGIYDYYLNYCSYINLVIAFIVTILLESIFARHGKARSNVKRKNIKKEKSSGKRKGKRRR